MQAQTRTQSAVTADPGLAAAHDPVRVPLQHDDGADSPATAIHTAAAAAADTNYSE